MDISQEDFDDLYVAFHKDQNDFPIGQGINLMIMGLPELSTMFHVGDIVKTQQNGLFVVTYRQARPLFCNTYVARDIVLVLYELAEHIPADQLIENFSILGTIQEMSPSDIPETHTQYNYEIQSYASVYQFYAKSAKIAKQIALEYILDKWESDIARAKKVVDEGEIEIGVDHYDNPIYDTNISEYEHIRLYKRGKKLLCIKRFPINELYQQSRKKELTDRFHKSLSGFKRAMKRYE